MKRRVTSFLKAEHGNAIIDWTVLMTGLIMMAFAVVSEITDQTDRITDDTLDRLEAIEVN